MPLAFDLPEERFDPQLDSEARAIAFARAERNSVEQRYERSIEPAEALAAARAWDPTSILDDEPTEDDLAGYTTPAFPDPWLERLRGVINVRIDMSAFVDAVRRLGEELKPVGFTSDGALREGLLREFLERKAVDPTINRKRHGRAAVCPMHGPTRGGLCRRCVR